MIYLDEVASILYVTGNLSQAQDIKEQLELLEGIVVPVSEAVWAELLRCRTADSAFEFSVANLQDKTNCRMHVDRLRPVVRVFGSKRKVSKAMAALEELEAFCSVESIKLPKLEEHIDLPKLKELVGPHVTTKLEGQSVKFLGRAEVVSEAARRVRSKFLMTNVELETLGPLEMQQTRAPCYVALKGKQPPGLAPMCESENTLPLMASTFGSKICSISLGDCAHDVELHYW